MEEVKNIIYEELMEVIKDFPIKPLRNRILITVNVDEDEGSIDLMNVGFAENQYIVALGSFNQDMLSPGDKVLIDVKKMIVPNTDQIEIDPVEVDGRIYAFINDSMIKAIDNR